MPARAGIYHTNRGCIVHSCNNLGERHPNNSQQLIFTDYLHDSVLIGTHKIGKDILLAINCCC